MNIKKAIELYKIKRKQSLINQLTLEYKNKYAFIGVGQHSLSTYYPILKVLDVPLKYILTKKSKYGSLVAKKFENAKSTFNYDDILTDPEVKGIFICSNPTSHYELTLRALKEKKHVFVEKPVCYSLDNLNHLIEVCSTNCIVGLQKRYSPINDIIFKRCSNTYHYYARYALGCYPEGNPVYDLFIHPVDNLLFLFGEGIITYFNKIINNGGVVISIQIKHSSGVHGTVELSTNHSWNTPIDILRIETSNEEIQVNYPNHIETFARELSFCGIPVNKILRKPVLKRILYNNTGLKTSVEENNLYQAGFVNEVKHFLSLVEGNVPSGTGTSDIRKLVNTYQLLDILNNQSL